jgi:hypothetical protein
MATLNARLALSLAGLLENVLDVGSATYPLNIGANFNFGDGTGANQGKTVFTDTRPLAASGTEDLDLNGTLTDAFGATVSFTKIRALIILADAANTNDVVVGGAAANGAISFFGAATDKVKVKPGGLVCLVAPDVNGYAIVAATADLLKIANGGAGTGVNYTIIVLGS